MILTILLVLILLVLGVFLASVISVAGAGAIILFGDVIVCIVFIIWLIKRLIDR
jgi:hypothetical protein